MQHRFFTGTASATVSNERFRIASDGKVSLGAGCSLEALGDLTIGASTSVVNIGTSSAAQTVNIGAGTGVTSVNIGNASDIVTFGSGLRLPTSTGVPSTLTFFEELSWTTQFIGPYSTVVAQPFRLSRIGSTVTVTMLPAFHAPSTAATSRVFKSTSAIPFQFRPGGNGLTSPVAIHNGVIAEKAPGWVHIDGDGLIEIRTFDGTGGFSITGPGSVGCDPFSVTYVRPPS